MVIGYRKRFSSSVLPLCLILFGLTWCGTAHAVSYGTNLLVNSGAEAGPSSPTGAPVSVPGWITSSAFTVIPYGAPGGFPTTSDYGSTDRGNQFFAGGSAAVSTASQDIDVSADTPDFATGQVGCGLSGWLGGFGNQDDNARVTVTFFSGATNLGSFSIGPLLAADRFNVTSLYYRANAASVPPGTNHIQVQLIMTRASGTNNDGYADSLTMMLIPTVAVVNTNDSGPGSLRAAVAYANTHPGSTIRFASGVTFITLTSGQLTITANTTIIGFGNGYPYVSGNNASRVFNIAAGATINMQSISVTNGVTSAVQAKGGGIYNAGTLTLSNGIVQYNTATTPSSQAFGGGIYNDQGTLNLINCGISTNYATSPALAQSFGGGIYNSGGTVTLSGCSLTGNLAGGTGGGNRFGGAICNADSIQPQAGTVTVTNCALTGNTAYSTKGSLGGGALYNVDTDCTVTMVACTISGNTVTGLDPVVYPALESSGGGIDNGGILILTNCTVSGNSVSSANNYGSGGGICHFGTSIKLTNCTISANSSTGNPPSEGGGIFNLTAGSLDLINTIIAGNSAGTKSDVSGYFNSLGHNVIGQKDGSDNGAGGSPWLASDLTGTTASPLNPVLGALADNGGPTSTMPLLPGSPAISAGDDAVLSSPYNLMTDQRGFPRKQGTKVDIGAFEYDAPTIGPTFLVTTTHNHDDGACGPLDCTLWEAINAANANADASTINFKPGLTGTITNTALPDGYMIFNPVTINGPGARILSVNGNFVLNNYTRIFNVATGASATISGLTFANGNSTAVGYGGAFFNGGTLTLSNCTLYNNAGIKGGGIYNSTGCTLTMNNCTVRYSQTSTDGGIDNVNGTATLTNCTVTDGRAYFGAGINNEGIGATLTLRSCTITGNFLTGPPDGLGGGVRNNGGTVNVGNTIIAGNSVFNGSSEDVAGTFTSQGFNLIGNSDGSTGFVNGTNSDQVGDGDSVLNALLGPFGNYGGPTDTFSLLDGSPAIDKGSNFGATTDQRGQLRPRDQAAIANASGGNGSDIGAFEVQPPSSIAGRIADANSVAVANVTVSRTGNNLPAVQTTTNSAGYYTLTNVPDGTYIVTPSLANYSFTPTSRSVTVGGSSASGVNFIAKTGANLSGRIATAAGVAIGSVTVSRSGSAQTVQTNSAGYYTFIGVQPGSVTTTPSKTGYRFNPVSKTISVGTADVSNVNFIGASGYNIVGRIANSSGIGQTNIVVKRSGSNITATTNSAGYFTFIDVPNGTHSITPTGNNLSFAPESRSVTINNADVSGQNFTVAPGYTVIGRITNSSGVAIAGVVVTRTGSAVTATTNSAGYYTFSNVANGTYTLTPSKAGLTFTPVTKSVTVSNANVSGQNFIGTGP